MCVGGSASRRSGVLRRSKWVSWARRWWKKQRGRALARSVVPPWDQGWGWWISVQAKGRSQPVTAQESWVRDRAWRWALVCRRVSRPRSRGAECGVEDGGDEAGVAGQAAGLAGGEVVAGLEPGRTEPGLEGVQVEGDEQGGAVGGVAVGGQVLEELGERQPSRSVQDSPGPDPGSVGSVTCSPSRPRDRRRGAVRVSRWRCEQLAVQGGDHELPGPGAVAVVAQAEPGLGLGGAFLAAEHHVLVGDHQLVGDRGAHPVRGPPQPLRVPGAVVAGAVAGALGDQPLLRHRHLLGGGRGGDLLGGTDDDPDLLDPQPPGRERLPGRGVLLRQQAGEPDPSGGGLPGGAGQRRHPRIRAGRRVPLGQRPGVRLGLQRQPPRLHLGPQRGQLRDRLADLTIRHRRDPDRGTGGDQIPGSLATPAAPPEQATRGST